MGKVVDVLSHHSSETNDKETFVIIAQRATCLCASCSMCIRVLRYEIQSMRHDLDKRQSRGSSMQNICSPLWDVVLSLKGGITN